MMFRGHSTSGLLAGLATAPIVSHEIPVQVAWTLVVAGGSLGPDIDMPTSTIGRMWGPITSGFRIKILGKRRRITPGLSWAVSKVAGGHRKGTHSIVGLLALLALVWLAQFNRYTTAFVVALAVGTIVLAIDVLIPGKIGWPPNLVASAIGAAFAFTQNFHLPEWLPFAMATGAAVHILGDMITVQGCPLTWPTGNTRNVSLLPMRAGGPGERWIVFPALMIAFVWLLAWRLSPDVVYTPIQLWGVMFR